MRTSQSASSDLVVRLFGDDKKSTYHGRYTFPAREGRIVESTSSYVLLKVRDLDQEMPVTLKVYDLREVQGDARELARSMWQSEVRALMQLVPYQWVEYWWMASSNNIFRTLSVCKARASVVKN
jgi:hypothetical protein